MTDNPDLADRLDAAFGDGPATLPPVHERLAVGRRALLRRRLVVGLGGLAVVIVFGTAFAAVGVDNDRADDPGPDPAAPPSTQFAGEPSLPGSDVELAPDGTLLVADGVDVKQRIENPLGFEAPDHSMAVAYTVGSETTWALLDYQVDGEHATSAVASGPARQAFDSLEDWVADQVALQNGDPTLQLVEFGDGETLLPLPGVEILEQTGEVDLPAGFAGPDARTAVARVRFEGERWFVLARQLKRWRPEYFPTAGSVGGRTLADFLAYAEGQYGGGEGLR